MKDRGKGVKDRERSEAGGRRSGGLRGRWGSLGLRGEGVRSGGSSLLPPTVFSGAETAGGWGGGASPRGEEAAGGKREGTAGDRAGVVLPRAAPSTAREARAPRLPPPAAGARPLSYSPPPAGALPPRPCLSGAARGSPRPAPGALRLPSPGVPPEPGGGTAGWASGRARGGQRDDGALEGEGRGRRRGGGGERRGAAHGERFVSCPHPTPTRVSPRTQAPRGSWCFRERGASCSGRRKHVSLCVSVRAWGAARRGSAGAASEGRSCRSRGCLGVGDSGLKESPLTDGDHPLKHKHTSVGCTQLPRTHCSFS